jgi:ABC-type lipoprotein export system ATPase subunit
VSLQAADVVFGYRGARTVLRGVSVEVPPDGFVGILGPNGSGKTTLLRVLTGDRAPSAGAVTVCGVDLMGAGERDRNELRGARLGLIDQRHARTLRPELSIVDNVALQLRVGGLRRRAARARAAGLLDTLGLGHLAGRRAVTLSGGEAQRVAVCAAVAHGPALILADEPTGELNRAAADAVYDLLAAAAAEAGAALVVVSHDAHATRIADRVVRIRDGRLSEQWHPAETGDETLVVDDRGWVRLPEPLRASTGVSTGVRAEARDGAIVLAARPPEPGPALPGPAQAGPAQAGPAQAGPAQAGPEQAGPEQAAPTGPVIAEAATVAELAGVRVRRGGVEVFSAHDLTLRAGTLTVVSGPSGSGKTTLLRVLTGLERPDEGRVTVAGTDLAGLDRAGLAGLRRGYVAVCGQDGALAETLNVDDNLELAREARGLADSPELVARWRDGLGLTGVRHRPVRVLSGGERQRVAVARSLSVQPVLAVLDEPTSQQDEANAERVVAVLVAAARSGMAVITATHDPVLIEAADVVVDLDPSR